MHVLAGSFFVSMLLIGLMIIGAMVRSHGGRMIKALAGQTGLPKSGAILVDLRDYQMHRVKRIDDVMPLAALPLAA